MFNFSWKQVNGSLVEVIRDVNKVFLLIILGILIQVCIFLLTYCISCDRANSHIVITHYIPNYFFWSCIGFVGHIILLLVVFDRTIKTIKIAVYALFTSYFIFILYDVESFITFIGGSFLMWFFTVFLTSH